MKMKSHFKYVKPFLLLLNALPEKIYDIKDEKVIDLTMITMDENIVAALRKV